MIYKVSAWASSGAHVHHIMFIQVAIFCSYPDNLSGKRLVDLADCIWQKGIVNHELVWVCDRLIMNDHVCVCALSVLQVMRISIESPWHRTWEVSNSNSHCCTISAVYFPIRAVFCPCHAYLRLPPSYFIVSVEILYHRLSLVKYQDSAIFESARPCMDTYKT